MTHKTILVKHCSNSIAVTYFHMSFTIAHLAEKSLSGETKKFLSSYFLSHSIWTQHIAAPPPPNSKPYTLMISLSLQKIYKSAFWSRFGIGNNLPLEGSCGCIVTIEMSAYIWVFRRKRLIKLKKKLLNNLSRNHFGSILWLMHGAHTAEDDKILASKLY